MDECSIAMLAEVVDRAFPLSASGLPASPSPALCRRFCHLLISIVRFSNSSAATAGDRMIVRDRDRDHGRGRVRDVIDFVTMRVVAVAAAVVAGAVDAVVVDAADAAVVAMQLLVKEIAAPLLYSAAYLTPMDCWKYLVVVDPDTCCST